MRFLWGILLLSYGFSSCSIVEYEKENNDTPVTALSQKIYSVPNVIQGSFNSVKDKDYYPIYIDKAGFYSIATTQAKGFDIRLSILDNNTKPIIVSDDYFKNFGEQIPCIFLEKRLYYVLVESKYDSNMVNYADNNEPNYSLLIQPFIFNPKIKQFSLSRSLRDTKNIQTIYPNTPLFGFFHPSDDPSMQSDISKNILDYISKLTKKAYTPSKIDLYAFLSPEKLSLLQLYLSKVQDTDSVILLMNVDALRAIADNIEPKPNSYILVDNNSYNEPEHIQDYPLNSNQYYIIAIIGVNRLNYKSFIESQQNYYKLDMSFTNNNKHTEKEPNQGIQTANIILDNHITGAINSRNDVDTFAISYSYITPPKIKTNSFLMNIKLTTNIKDSLELRLLNSKGEILKQLDSNTEDQLGINISSIIMSKKKPLYYLQVIAHKNLPNEIPYNIEIDTTPIQPNKEIEPNDFIPTYNGEYPAILIKNFISGNIEYIKDQDTYFYQAKKTGIYNFSISSIPISLTLLLYDNNNHLISAQKSIANRTFFWKIKLKPSIYKIVLKATNLKEYTHENDYTLTINKS